MPDGSVGPGAPTSVGNWMAATSGSQDPEVMRGRITPVFGQPVELYHWHDFEVDAQSASDNLFDVIAEVDWTHEDGITVRESLAYYTGEDKTFSFRFGAEKLGSWTGVTSSSVAELDGLTLNATVTALTNQNRSGYHVFDPQNPTWWMQQKGPSGEAVRIAPRLMALPFTTWTWWDDTQLLQDLADLWVDDYGLPGCHVFSLAGSLFDAEDMPTLEGNPRFVWDFSNMTGNENPDPRMFATLETLIDIWLSKGGHVHIWQYSDGDRDGSSSFLPGGANGTLSQRIDRYITARLGPVPGWSLGYSFDAWDAVTQANMGVWVDRIATRLGWHHWIGCRAVDGPTVIGGGNPFNNCSSDPPHQIRSGGYPEGCGVPWNTITDAPPQYASWEQHWPTISDHIGGGHTAQDIIDDLAANTAAGIAAIDDRPHFSEDRFWFREGGEFSSFRDIADEDEFKAVLEAYGMAGWAGIYGKLDDGHVVTGSWVQDVSGFKAVNDAITAAMEGS